MYCQYISYIFFAICTIFFQYFPFFSDILCTMCYVKIVNYYSFTEMEVLLMIKKYFKKLVSVALAAAMVMGMSVTAFANETPVTNNNETKITLNEYELAEQLAAQTPETLSEEGFDSDEIASIKNYKEVYREHISSLNTLSDDALSENGYSREQISIIRSFDGSEAEMRRLGATLTLSATAKDFSYDGNYSHGTLSYSWSWGSVPAFKMQDMIAASWNNWAVTSNSSSVNYYNVNTGAYYTTKSATFSQDGNGVLGAGHKFSESLSDNYYYAKSGTGYFKVKSDVHAKKDFYYYIAYGHSQLIASINFSVGIGGGDASISFTTGTVIADDTKGSKVTS